MAILKIARMGHPVLRQRAADVADPKAPAVHGLVRDMYETMVDANGAGLAAPQVHVPLRVVMFQVTAARGATEDEAAEVVPLTVLINPVIEPLGEERADGWEGCLSVPGLRGLVSRFARIRYTGITPAGEAVERIAEGFHVWVVQHECDHLDGILYPQRMSDLGDLIFETEFRHYLQPTEADAEAEADAAE